MNLIDIRERLGPFWAAYQDYRYRHDVIDNPDFVPEWFIAKLARDRVLAARVAVERTARPNDEQAREIWAALGVLADAIGSGTALDPVINQLIAGLLGAQEVETARERRDAQREQLWAQAPGSMEMADRRARERVELAKRHLRERGITTSSELAAVHEGEDALRESVRRAQWAALDAIAEEARA